MNAKPAKTVKELKAIDARAQAEVQPKAPEVKIRAHLFCIVLAIVLTVIVPQVVHEQVISAATLFAPNILQETIDRLLKL